MRKLTTIAVGALAALLLAIPAIGAMHHNRDANHDRLPDRWEKRHHLSLKVKQAKRNQDGDGLRNRGEYRQGTDPRDPDTDDDGVMDGKDKRPCKGGKHDRPPPPENRGGDEQDGS